MKEGIKLKNTFVS